MLNFISSLVHRQPRSQADTREAGSPWVRLLGGGEGYTTKSGQAVSESSALTILAVWAAVRLIAETLNVLPMLLYQRDDDDTRTRARNHPVYRLIHDDPNPYTDAGQFRETLTAHTLTWGNGYAEIERDNAGRPIALWPLRPDCMMNVRAAGGRLKYLYRTPQGAETTLDQEQVFHIAGLGFNGVQGYSPIRMAREALGAGKAAEAYAARFYDNNATPPAVISHPGKLEDKGRTNLKRTWQESHGGVDKAHKIAVLEEGMSLTAYGINPEDSQLLESRKFSGEQVAQLYRVPPHKMQILEHATYSNIEHQGIEFATDTITPWARRWERQIRRKLLTPAEQRTYYAEMLLDALQRGDTTNRYQGYATARQWGWLSINDIRRLENRNTIGPQGDIYLSPLNMVSADQLASPPDADSPAGRAAIAAGASARALQLVDARTLVPPPPPPPPPPGSAAAASTCTAPGCTTPGCQGHAAGPPGARAAWRAASAPARRSITTRRRIQRAVSKLIEDAAARVVRFESNAVTRQLRRLEGPNGTADFDQWLSDFYAKSQDYIRRAYAPAIAVYADQVAGEIGEETNTAGTVAPELETFTGDFTDALAGRHASSSRGQLRTLVLDADPAVAGAAAAAVALRLDEWQAKRAAKTATREAARAGNALAREAYKTAGITRLRWVAFGSETCPICTELDGQVVGIERSFVPAGATVQAGQDQEPITTETEIFHPPLHDGCECQITAA